MATTDENIRALDQLRQRLSQLSSSIATLRADLERSEPLPTWPSLQSSAQALSFNLQQLGDTFKTHGRFLQEAHAYPLPNFPGLTQEALLGQLLRKKLEPGAEDWVDEYTVRFENKEKGAVNGATDSNGAMSATEMRELWTWAAPTSAGIVGPMLEDGGAFEDDYTIAEREAGVENVVTGLRRKLDDEEDEDEDEEEGERAGDDKMEDVVSSAADQEKKAEEALSIDRSRPALPVGNLVKLMVTGTFPNSNTATKR